MTSLAEAFDLPPGHTATSARANANGHVVITRPADMPRLGWLSRITAGGILLASAGLLLLALAAAMGIVSWHAQFAFIYAIKHQRLAASLEAIGLDAGAVVFSILGIALARLGRRAIIERALVCICAAGSMGMNAAGADLASPRSVAAFIMPPLLFAITSDRLIAVIRRTALGRLDDTDSQRSAWRLAGTAFLYSLRFLVAPRSTAAGARLALLNATPLPQIAAPRKPAAIDGPKPGRAPKPRTRKVTGPTKTERLITLASERHDLAVIDPAAVSAIATALAPEIPLHPATARRELLARVRQIQENPS